MNCIVCSAPMQPAGERFDDRYGYPGHYELHCCTACGHLQTGVTMTPEQIARLYTEYYPRSDFDVEAWCPPREHSRLVTWWRGLKASAFRWVPRNVRVLDIGCGFGESLGYHRNRGCDAHGVEADTNILRVAQRHGLNVKTGLFDARQYEAESFDVVTLDQVIEHVSSPLEVLNGIRQVLKPDGMLVLSTPNANGWGAMLFGQRWIHWHAPYHQQFFSRQSMAQAAEAAGYVIARRATVTNSAWLGFQWCHLLAYPKRGSRSAFWSSTEPRTTTQRLGFLLLAVVNRIGLNPLLSRLFDALGIGDNLVYVLRKADRR